MDQNICCDFCRKEGMAGEVFSGELFQIIAAGHGAWMISLVKFLALRVY